MKTILITGGCGFIGANFIRYLLTEADFDGTLINVDKLTYAGNPESLQDIATDHARRYRFIQADICDDAAMDVVFRQNPVDAICHFAAESHVDRSIVAPDAFIQSNITGTFRLLELARRYQDRLIRFHHISTDEVFGSLGPTGFFTETTPYDPSSPYSASKAASDHLVNAYGRTYGLPITISNCSNNYGPYQFPEKLIPLMILNALAGKPLPVYGDGANVRDWLYVTDHCRAIWAVMTQGQVGQTYNVGGHCEKTNLDVVSTICERIDARHPNAQAPCRDQITFVTDRPGHDRRYAIDASKIETQLGWRPRESFDSGIEKTIAWYIDNQPWVQRVLSGEYRNWIEQHYQI